MKKALSVILFVILAMALSVTAFAEETWMNEKGFPNVQAERISFSTGEELEKCGVNVETDEEGFVRVTFDENVDEKGIRKIDTDGIFNLSMLPISVQKPEGASSVKWSHSCRYYNIHEDYFYLGGWDVAEKWANDEFIDANGNVTVAQTEIMYYEYNGAISRSGGRIGIVWLWWYDSQGNLMQKECVPYVVDTYNYDKPAAETVIWNEEDYVASGYCGTDFYGSESVAWTFDSNGILAFIGKGAICDTGWQDFGDGNVVWTAPWADYRYDIKRVVVGEGISVLEGVDGLSDDVPVYFLGNAPSVWRDTKNAYILEGAEGFDIDEKGLWNGYTVNTFKIEDMPWAESIIIDSGECGESLYWKLNAKGELIIYGTGEMYDYPIVNMGSSFDYVTSPWDDYRSSIKKIIFEEGITYIGLNAFLNIRISGDLILPEGLESVGSCAFQWNSFSSITLPSTLTKIHMGAFDSRTLEKFIVAEDNPEFTVKDNALFTKDGKVLVAFPGSVKGEYTVPEGVEVLDGDAFAGSNLEKIILPKSLKTIGQYAFNWVNAEVFVNSALESVESWAFYPWPGQNISVYFMNGAPASVKADSFTPPADAVVELYYYEGTEHLWEFDENGLWNGYEVTMLERPADATLSIDSASIVLGSSKHIKVTMSENSNAALMQFAVKYDPNALKVISCTAGNAVADATINTAEEGMIYFVWEALDSITEKEVLLDIEFAPAEGAEVQNTVVEIVTEGEEFFFADDNLGSLKIDTENGEIRIIDVIYGDINGDEKVNVLDANLIRRYSAKIMEFDDRQLLAADVSGDGKVNVLDANLVRRYAAKLINIFPVEE